MTFPIYGAWAITGALLHAAGTNREVAVFRMHDDQRSDRQLLSRVVLSCDKLNCAWHSRCLHSLFGELTPADQCFLLSPPHSTQ